MSTTEAAQPSGAVAWASRLVVLFAAIVAVNWVVAVVLDLGATGTDLSFAVLLLLAASISAHGIRRLARWAWWSTAALALAGLFFVAPVTGTILLGGGSEPVGTGWDVVFFPLMTAVLLSLVLALRGAWRDVTAAADRSP